LKDPKPNPNENECNVVVPNQLVNGVERLLIEDAPPSPEKVNKLLELGCIESAFCCLMPPNALLLPRLKPANGFGATGTVNGFGSDGFRKLLH
jgi:hypothetical protein